MNYCNVCMEYFEFKDGNTCPICGTKYEESELI